MDLSLKLWSSARQTMRPCRTSKPRRGNSYSTPGSVTIFSFLVWHGLGRQLYSDLSSFLIMILCLEDASGYIWACCRSLAGYSHRSLLGSDVSAHDCAFGINGRLAAYPLCHLTLLGFPLSLVWGVGVRLLCLGWFLGRFFLLGEQG